MQKSYITSKTSLPKSFGDSFLELEKGKGVFLWDKGGKKYLDFGSGIAVNSLGYSNKGILSAIRRQSKKIIHTSNLYTSEPTTRLAKELTSLGEFDAVHLGNSGTEANEAAIKFARLYSLSKKGKGHTKLLSFEGAFHGRTLGALTLTPTPKYKDPFGPLLPDCYTIAPNDIELLKNTLDDSFAGIIIEPLQGEGGLNSFDPAFIQVLNELCKSLDIILIADEVQTGLGRTGSMFASELVGLKPDIITLAKPLGGGLPLSATLIPQKINDLLKPGHHGSTFGGGPLTSAVALEVMKVVNDKTFLKGVTDKGDYLVQQLDLLKQDYSCLGQTKGMGLLRGIELDETKAGFTIAELIGEARNQGLLILRCGSNVIRLAPPLVITVKEIDQALALLRTSLNNLTNGGLT
ncbi:aspartate aminotransferase family protein [Spirochaeta cellobiosiphila]|uniref:aspartate aminotransferase family protein n=1 Tax=Spirochaeta cellobiosiphila TaxID=504483 RepID=UPI000411B7FE|nr:acetylornithine/succinylornithine family transaminase [Spirochaeta cellobiosiphila]